MSGSNLSEGFWCGQNIFSNIKKLKNSTNKKVKKSQKLIKEALKKKSKKKTKGVLICREAQNVHTANMKKYLFTKISRVTEYQNTQYFVLDKGNVAKVHNWEFFSCRRCFLSFHLQVKVVENLISSGIEDHTFGPMNLREHFPEEELTLVKTGFWRLLVLWNDNGLS